ncbi:Uma2 family endonuclease [Nocardia donostiensis]|uniref:Uma2 family endonuclease n=1 Tax=Nocardia donostiensis TaxID=1538463 RepID=UPI001C376EBD|nr:Uma2 family endonuclease [Nocardia donostiensis]
MTTATAPEPRDPADVLLEGFHALETPEGFRAELIEGEIIVTPPPGGTHEGNIASVVRQVMRNSATETDFSGNKGLVLDRGGLCPRNHVIPDGVFAPVGAFRDEPPWMPCAPVILVVEVTSDNPDRDRKTKRYCYARAGIPLYLLVDRRERTVTLFSEPGGAGDLVDYRQDVRMPFGKPVDLPEPFAFPLDTADFG